MRINWRLIHSKQYKQPNIINMEKKKRVYNVPPDMRTNPLSLTPGGSTVEVYFEGYSTIYTNIKSHKAYVNKILASKDASDIVSIRVDDEFVYHKN